MKRVMTRDALNAGRCSKNRQDGNREFVSCLACISAKGKKIPATLLYQGASGDLQDSWVEEVKDTDEVFFGSTEKGWTSDKVGLAWLEQVFERHTQPTNPRIYRLLIVDGHSSHVNMKFIDWADRHRIIILILPPHSTHKLQPLDVGMFLPLSTFYSAGLDRVIVESGGLVSITKRMFYPIFKAAWDTAFTEKNIKHAFAKPGIWPAGQSTNRDKILAATTKKSEPVPLFDGTVLHTPKNAQTLRHFQANYAKSPTPLKVNKMFETLEGLATNVDILQHEIRGLRKALIAEKSRRKRGKKLNLAGEISKGVELYSPNKVVRARQFQEQKAQEEQAERDAIEARKLVRAQNALEKQIEKEEKEVQHQIAIEIKVQGAKGGASSKASSLKTSPVRVKAKKTAVSMPTRKQSSKAKGKALINLTKPTLPPPEVLKEVGSPVRRITRTRTITLPMRFKI